MAGSPKGPFKKLSANVSFPEQEEEVLDLWDELDAFHESNRRREGQGKPFVFYDGPPFANGSPHYGHLLAGTIKDIIPRYWNMRGHFVERRFGWDCHGLPVESMAQNELGLAGTSQILEAGVDVFNEKCRAMVESDVSEWHSTVRRMGRWVDFENDYKTMDLDFMESVWWVFKQLWEQKRIYKSYRIMPYSWKLTTPLSNFEANQNYKDVQDPAVTVRFAVKSSEALEKIGVSPSDQKVSLLAWTTTPWTLPANLALCAGPEIEYVAVKVGDEVVVLAKDRLKPYFKGKDIDVLGSVTGAALKGTQYEPLLPFFADRPNCFQVLADEFVSTGDGTGIVHLAPAYGEDDFRVCREVDIELIDPLDAEARFESLVPDWEGEFCKDADSKILARLKGEGKVYRHDTITHSYPFDDRTDTPLIYRAIEAWYVRVTDLRDDLVAQNDTVTWVPQAIGAKRFGNWLRNANDWNISRNRFWGSCLPIWINENDPEDMICVGSRAELEELCGEKVDDLHKHILDKVLIEKDGKTYRRTPEVLDCWFESGSMPYAQQHYPFKEGDAQPAPGKDQRFKDFFPANFIAEGLDQTRGWFYTLLILGTALYGKSPYQNVIVNGMILAEDGEKMSKRKKNYPDPKHILNDIGADCLRAYMVSSPVVRAEPLLFSEKGLREIARTVVLPYWNALSFFCTYAELDAYDPKKSEQVPLAERPDTDRWILSVLQSLILDVNKEMEGYRLYSVVPRLVRFIDDLTNWYIRVSRPRFWKSTDARDQASAFATLYEVLITFAKVLAPVMPFLTEVVHQKLVRPVDEDSPQSVHFCDYPEAQNGHIDAALEARMEQVRAVVVQGRKLREEHRLKVRQPLRRLTVVHREEKVRQDVLASAELIQGELNIKEVQVEANEGEFVTLTIKPNFKTLGKRCGPRLGGIKKALGQWGAGEVARLEAGESIAIGEDELTLEDVLLTRKPAEGAAVATNGNITVALETRLDEELESEGFAREFVSQVQSLRKTTGLEVSDRIILSWKSDDEKAAESIRRFSAYISGEVLATDVSDQLDANATEVQVNNVTVTVGIQRA